MNMNDYFELRIPVTAKSIEECMFLCVECDDEIVSSHKYAALFFEKIRGFVEDARTDDDFIENLALYCPSLSRESEETTVKDLTWKIIESEEFYYSFPPVDAGEVEMFDVTNSKKVELLGFDADDLACDLEDSFNLYGLLAHTSSMYNSYLARNSESAYDRKLSLILMGIEE